MKPDGRSLDIVVVGLGQAGGNLAAEFHRRGYRALALNTAETDLSALASGGVFPEMPEERRIYVGLDGYDGAGADPSYGRDCINAHADRIRAAILKQASDADVVILAAGLGGGTGSSIPELVKVLEDEQLPLLLMLTLPTQNESALAKVNAVRAINDVVGADLLGWIFIDNDRISTLNPDVSVVDYFPHINGQIAAPLDALNRLNARDGVMPIRSFDGEDFRKLLLSGGVLNLSYVEIPSITPDEVLGAVTDALSDSDIMPAGFDMKKMSYVGLVIEAPEDALADAPISTFEEIAKSIKAETEGAAVYYGIYRTKVDGPVAVRLIAATQSLPAHIRSLLGEAQREGKLLGEKVQEELPELEMGGLDGIEMFRTKARPSERPSRRKNNPSSRIEPKKAAQLVDDIAKEIGAAPKSNGAAEPRRAGRSRVRPKSESQKSAPPPAAAPTPAAQPAPGKRRGPPKPPPAPPRDIGTEEIDVVAALAELGDPDQGSDDLNETVAQSSLEQEKLRTVSRARGRGVPNGDAPSPETYDRLVASFLTAKTKKEKKSIADRLVSDSEADDTVVRYYAVEAMAKLGRQSFANALLAATEDEDDAVRTLAVEALKR